MTNSPSAMPGAFNFHPSSNPPPREAAPPRLSGAKSHIFQPPRTPSASASSSLILTRSTASVMSLSSAGDRPTKFMARKRTHNDYNEGLDRNKNNGTDNGYDWGNGGMEDTVPEGWIPSSPKPLVNTRYQLAGGMDTPSLAAAREAEEPIYNDVGYRKSLGGDVERPREFQRGLFGEHEAPSYFGMEEPLGRESNGRGRGYYDSPRGEGWGKAAIQVVGGVVGKVWEFCKSSGTIFKGFHAGGGTGYKINPDDTAPNFAIIEEENTWNPEKTELFEGREGTPLPGQYPQDDLDFIPDYIDRATPESTPRPAKRRQVSSNNNTDEIAKNWVVVPPAVNTPTSSRAQTRGPARYSMPTASSASRRSVYANTSSHRPASRVAINSSSGSRRPAVSRVSHAGSPALNSGHGASYATARSPVASGSRIPRATNIGSPIVRNGVTNQASSGSGSGAPESPAAKEAARWAALKRKEEREQDESLRRLDKQLKDLIREGKEALGTKIEVELVDEPDVVNYGGSRKWAF